MSLDTYETFVRRSDFCCTIEKKLFTLPIFLLRYFTRKKHFFDLIIHLRFLTLLGYRNKVRKKKGGGGGVLVILKFKL